MKKSLLILSVFVGIAVGASAQACTPSDTTHMTGTTYSYPDSLPCFTKNAAYAANVTIKCPGYTYATYTVQADSIQIDSITNLPTGITDAITPASGKIYSGHYGCIALSGIPTDTGSFKLDIHGTLYFTVPAAVPIIGGTAQNVPIPAQAYPITLNSCDTAHYNGIAQIANDIALSIYPNPNQGNFTVTVSSDSRLTGTMSVVDQLGRTINTQTLDVTGTKQIPLALGDVAPGVYTLLINTNGQRSAKQFIVK